MKKTILILALLTVISCIIEKQRRRNGFKQKLDSSHIFEKEQFQLKSLNKKKEIEKISESNEEITTKINKLGTTWKAKVYEKKYKPLLGVNLDDLENLPQKKFESFKGSLPEEYDPRTEYPKCESLREIRDQTTSSALALAAVQAMSDRICIKSGQTDQTRVSAKNLIACCPSCLYPGTCWNYWKTTGIANTNCVPDNFNSISCVKNCDEGNREPYSTQLTYGLNAYSVSGEANIMQEIYENGPVEASFTVYNDFTNYQSGVYQHVTGSTLGGHTVKMLGWGVENGVKYWLCANSWGVSWGDRGYFKIRRGNNECGIENSVNAGEPKL